MTPFIEQIYHGVYNNGNTPDSKEQLSSWQDLFNCVDKYRNPQFDELTVSNELYECASNLVQSNRTRGFQLGIDFALRLTAEIYNQGLQPSNTNAN